MSSSDPLGGASVFISIYVAIHWLPRFSFLLDVSAEEHQSSSSFSSIWRALFIDGAVFWGTAAVAAMLASEGTPTCAKRTDAALFLLRWKLKFAMAILVAAGVATCFISTPDWAHLTHGWVWLAGLRTLEMFRYKLHVEYHAQNDDGEGEEPEHEPMEKSYLHSCYPAPEQRGSTSLSSAIHFFTSRYNMFCKYWIMLLVWSDVQRAEPVVVVVVDDGCGGGGGHDDGGSHTTMSDGRKMKRRGGRARTASAAADHHQHLLLEPPHDPKTKWSDWKENVCFVIIGGYAAAAVVDACASFRVSEMYGTAEVAMEAVLFELKNRAAAAAASTISSASAVTHSSTSSSPNGLSHALFNLYIHSFAFCILIVGIFTFADGVFGLALPLIGLHHPRIMANPALGSRTVGDFWGKRWNRSASRLLRNTAVAMVPQLDRNNRRTSSAGGGKKDRRAAGTVRGSRTIVQPSPPKHRRVSRTQMLAAFAISATLHTSQFLFATGGTTPFYMSCMVAAFFMSQVGGIMLERAVLNNKRFFDRNSVPALLVGQMWAVCFVLATSPLVAVPTLKLLEPW